MQRIYEAETEPQRDLINRDNAPHALVEWARGAYSDRIVIQRVTLEFECQGEVAQPGDWLVEFDAQLGVLFRQVGTKRLCVVTRNDGMPAEILELASD